MEKEKLYEKYYRYTKRYQNYVLKKFIPSLGLMLMIAVLFLLLSISLPEITKIIIFGPFLFGAIMFLSADFIRLYRIDKKRKRIEKEINKVK